MNVMKTSLTIIPMCPRELLSHYYKLSRLILCYIKDWATLLHLIYFHYLLVTNYLAIKLLATYSFSTCLEEYDNNVCYIIGAIQAIDKNDCDDMQNHKLGDVMTHKYRGSIIVLSISKCGEPNEEQKEMTSGFQ